MSTMESWRAILCCCAFLLTTLQGVSSQQPEVCQSLVAASQRNPLCQPVGNCTGLMCQLQNRFFNGSVASFQARKCQDPVVVELLITSSNGTVGFQREFNRSQTVFDTLQTQVVRVQVTMVRNATYLNFSALAPQISTQLIPPTLVPLNTTECMCESLEDLANIIHSPIEHDCSTTSNCDGVHCELDIFGNVFFVEAVILPCTNPPAAEVIVQNSQQQNIFGAIFNTTEQRDIVILGTRITVDAIIVHRDYSMDVEASLLSVPVFGRIDIFPRHTIILDRTNCTDASVSLPPTVAPVTPTETTPTPPSNASDTCLVLYKIVQNSTTEPFVCRLREGCDGFWCRLDIADTYYNITIQVENFTGLVLDEFGMELRSWSVMNSITVNLPILTNTSLRFFSSLRGATLGVKIDLATLSLQGNNQQGVIMYTLLPYSEIPVAVGTETPGVSSQQPEVCQSLIAASQRNPLCQPVGNCTGLMCQLQNRSFNGSVASFQVRKCQDPVVVELLITSSDGTVGFQREFSRSQTVFDTLQTQVIQVQVTMARNATYLNFSALAPLISAQLIPPTLVPLNTTECMCESLEDLADIIHSPIEHDCSTTSNCDGVHCELDIFGNVFFVEAVILPCTNPPAAEVIVQNSQRQNIFGAIFNTSGQRDIVILGTRITVDAIIVHRNYSMDVEASLSLPLLGQIDILPRHTIILDRSNCTNASVSLPPTVAPVTPTETTPTPPSSASDTCRALYEIVRKNTTEPFVCRLREGCDGFWCRLDIADTYYNITIQVVDLTGLVLDAFGGELRSWSVKNSVTVNLPKPTNTNTSLRFNSSLRGATLGVKIDLMSSWLRANNRPRVRVHTLLPYSEIPVTTAAPTGQLSDSAVAAIASTISIISFLIILILATIAIFSFVKYKQNRRRKEQFDFQSISFGDVKNTGEEHFTEIEDEKRI